MTIGNAFSLTGVLGVIATVAFFYLWFVLTIAILCVMEGTSGKYLAIPFIRSEFTNLVL